VFVNADANHSISRRDSTSEDVFDSLGFDMPVPKPKTLMVGLTSVPQRRLKVTGL